jgi:hypothetical protein
VISQRHEEIKRGETGVSKYHSNKVIVTSDGTIFKIAELKQYNQPIPEGIKFDSMAEAEYYLLQRMRLRQGIIKGLELQPKFTLQEKLIKDGVTHRAITYIADFKIFNNDGTVWIVDIKGFETKDFRLKRKLFEAKYPELTLRLITKYQGVWTNADELKKQKTAQKRLETQLLKRAKVSR